MYLIDALYITSSGGLILLKYLLKHLESTSLLGHVLLDSRVKDLVKLSSPGISISYMDASEAKRKVFYREKAEEFSVILCFANVPPPVKVQCRVYTYFHNIFLAKLPHRASFANKLKWKIKQAYIWFKRSHTDYWIVQTANTASELRRVVGCSSRIMILPFYDRETFLDTSLEDQHERKDYAFVANYIPAKNHHLLVEAWCELAKRGNYPVLHLTLGNAPDDLIKRIDNARKNGVNIINHGSCEKTEVRAIYACSKATVYPSENESFGLGIIEAMECGCDVIGPKHAFIDSICVPSETFDYQPDSIADAVLRYENKRNKSMLKCTNKITKLIQILSK